MMTKTTFLQKFYLFFFAFGVTLLILEVGLRLGGWAFFLLQENHNRKNIDSNTEYRILCLGESTTALGGENAYPAQLERILNSRSNARKFKVINKGFPATTTDQILAKVPGYLDEYKPQLVVSMMGINDPQDFAKRSWREKLSQYSKAFKLFDMIVSHWSAKQQEARVDFVQIQIAKLERQALLQPSSRIFAELAKANLYRSANHPEDEKKTILNVLSLDPQNSQAWHLLGIYYQRHAEHQKALEAFQNAYRFGPPEMKVASLEPMAQAYKFLNQYDKAEKIYRDIISQQPHHPQVNGAIGDILLEQNEYQQAINFYVQQLAIDPRSVDVYGKLAHCYRRTENGDKARAIFEAGAKVNADNPEFFYEWGYALLEDKKYSQAQNAFEQALKFNKNDVRGVNDRINERLLECYQAQNKTSQAIQLKNQMQKQAGRYNPATQKNYRALAQILAKRGIGLVAVQYPHRELSGLEDMLSSQTGIVFVDNQEIFQKEIEKVGYDQVFTDRFAGDFGHCTPKGNRLLAQHIAEVILNLCKP